MQTTTVTSEDSFIPAPAVNGDFNHSPLIVDGMQLRLSEERLETDLRESSRPRAAPFVPASQCTAQPIDSNGKEHANEVEIVMDMATQAEPISKECQAPRRNAFYRWISRKAKALMTRPLWLVCIFLLLCALIGLGVWGVIESSLTEQASRQSTATSAAIETSLTLRSVILGAFQPAITLGTLIATQEPQDWGSVLQTFYQTIPGIFDLSQSAPIINIQLLPNGIVGVIEPDLGFETSIGLDLLRDPASRAIALDGIGRTTLGLIGPQETNASILGIIGRYSIFVPGSHPDATFGFVPPFDRNLYSPSGGNCPIDLCYRNSSVEKFWGFSQVVVGWQDVVSLSGLYNLCGSYQFMMTSSGSSATVEHAHNGMAMAQCSDVTHLPSIFPRIMNGTSGSGTPPSFQSLQPISIPIPIFDQQWTLWIVESQGWVPTWQAPLIAVVVIVGVVFALLVLLLMASFLEQGQTLADLQASNRKLDEARTVLEAEKANTDALIIRHLNLISCFSDEKMNKAHRTSMEVSTLERIEAVRRHLKIGGNDPEEMEVLELLGSGSYGKVYRGLWRGTQVAIKTIVLPANMSGTAKREKMVIMEAAISSALTHPNIVQTYTYAIRPIQDTVMLPFSDVGSTGSAQVTADSNGSMYANVPSSKGSGDSSDKNTGQIFSYEIRLVLEYCDLGCLRDALDVKAFANDQGFNFPAILDTALDIARAMHHLHVSNVLHMDLKPRNIMIKSSGAGQGGGRGLTAKVADFGLSVSLDSNQTHASSIYQGTITHMAPEVLMNGRVSKAADVYSFGILLWELYTGGTAFSNIPGPHIGHAITTGKRPIFSLATPPAYQLLAETCWSPDPEARPTFPQIIQCLQSIKLGQPATLALDISWLKEEMAKLKGRPIKGKSPVESGSKLIPVGQARGQPRISRKARGGQVSMRYGHMPAGTGIVIVGGAGFSNQSSEGSVSESYSSLGLGKPLERVLEVRESMDESVQGSGDGISFAREASSRASRSRADMIDEGQEIG